LSSGLDERLVLEVVAKALDELGGLADPRRGAPGSGLIRALSTGELVTGARKGWQPPDEYDYPRWGRIVTAPTSAFFMPSELD
jgi:hypothetical protein